MGNQCGCDSQQTDQKAEEFRQMDNRNVEEKEEQQQNYPSSEVAIRIANWEEYKTEKGIGSNQVSSQKEKELGDLVYEEEIMG